MTTNSILNYNVTCRTSMYRYDDSEGSPNRNGVSMFLAYRYMPLQTDRTIFFTHLSSTWTNAKLGRLVILFRAKWSQKARFWTSAATSAYSAGGASVWPSGGASSGPPSAGGGFVGSLRSPDFFDKLAGCRQPPSCLKSVSWLATPAN